MQKEFDQKQYLSAIEELFRKHGTRERAEGAKAYMRDQFEYIGLDTTQRRKLQQVFHKEHALPPVESLPSLVKACWKNEYREMQYFAMELCEQYRKQFPKTILGLFEHTITHKSWWDTVDFISPKLVARYFERYPETIIPTTSAWMKSKNIWLMRAALVFQNLHKKKTDEKLLFKLILQCSAHEDFFIRKAIGWSLRQYARTNPASVKRFVLSNKNKLSELSKKEALKHL